MVKKKPFIYAFSDHYKNSRTKDVFAMPASYPCPYFFFDKEYPRERSRDVDTDVSRRKKEEFLQRLAKL